MTLLIMILYLFLGALISLHLYLYIRKLSKLGKRTTTSATFFKRKTVVISGGSSGIGLSIAKEILKFSSNSNKKNLPKTIVLIARDLKKLEESKQALEKQISMTRSTTSTSPSNLQQDSCQVMTISCDVTKKEKVEEMFNDPQNSDVLNEAQIWFLNQGMAIPKYFLQQEVRFEKQQFFCFFFNCFF